MLIEIGGIERPEVPSLLSAWIGDANELAGFERMRPSSRGRNYGAKDLPQRKSFLSVEVDLKRFRHLTYPSTRSPLRNQRAISSGKSDCPVKRRELPRSA